MLAFSSRRLLLRSLVLAVLGLACIWIAMKPWVASAPPATLQAPAVLAPTPDDGKTAPIPRASLPPIFKDVLAPEDVVLKKMAGPSSLTTWIVQSPQRPSEVGVLYTLDNDRLLLSGGLFGSSTPVGGQSPYLRNYTSDTVERYRPVIDYAKFWPDIEHATWIREGASDAQAKFVLYGFFDANCVYCHLSWLALHPYLQEGLQMRWIPVAVLAPDSMSKAAAILTAADPEQALAAGQPQWATQHGDAFPRFKGDIPAAIRGRVEANNRLMQRLGSTGTPTFAFKDKDGKINVQPGLLHLSQIPAVTGLARIPNTDPQLATFQQELARLGITQAE